MSLSVALCQVFFSLVLCCFKLVSFLLKLIFSPFSGECSLCYTEFWLQICFFSAKPGFASLNHCPGTLTPVKDECFIRMPFLFWISFFSPAPMKPVVVVDISFDFWIVSALIGLRFILLEVRECCPCYSYCYLKFLCRNSLGSTHWRGFSHLFLSSSADDGYSLQSQTSQPKKHLYKKNAKWEMAKVSVLLFLDYWTTGFTPALADVPWHLMVFLLGPDSCCHYQY